MFYYNLIQGVRLFLLSTVEDYISKVTKITMLLTVVFCVMFKSTKCDLQSSFKYWVAVLSDTGGTVQFFSPG